jgi:hypothetical protein
MPSAKGRYTSRSRANTSGPQPRGGCLGRCGGRVPGRVEPRSSGGTGDWLTVQVLLAGNFVVFGVSEAHQLGAVLTTLVVLAGVLLLAAAIWMYQRRPRERG